MRHQALRTGAFTRAVLVILLGSAWLAQAQGAKEPYPTMAPLDQYLMTRDAEIALARSAAPESISHDAEVMVLGRHGYETAVKGKNGFDAWCNDRGARESMIPIFGILNCGLPSVLTRRLRDSMFLS